MRHPTVRRRPARALIALLLGAALFVQPGCAAFTGLLTGAFTGCVDAPMQVYRHNKSTMDHHPEYWAFNALFVGPLGFAAGPLVGFVKGLSVDLQWLLGRTRYGKAFGSYRSVSVWRPYTIHWR
ncbi:MAG: hypothetical protein D6731_07265 [Planctomycetota bacterium]|nr:MAG: hypothetical protein D6731_07265 [Planctomycetota bacterium]